MSSLLQTELVLLSVGLRLFGRLDTNKEGVIFSACQKFMLSKTIPSIAR